MLDENKRDEGMRHLRQGLAFERANRTVEAVEQYRRAIEHDPRLREAHNALGHYYQRSGLMAKAAEEFRAVAALDGDFMSFYNLGYVLVELERYDDALVAFTRCLSLQPDDASAHFEVGYILLLRGEYTRALSHLQQTLQSYPADWEAHNLIGKCQLGLRHFDEALAAFGRSLSLTESTLAQAELLDNIATVARHREFHSLSSLKDQVYAEEGVVYLGSAQDNGLQVAELKDYHFSYPDIGITLQRLTALAHSSGWRFSAVVPGDALSRPLAEALATLLTAPMRSIDELSADDRALVVIAVAREAELLLLTIERTPCPLIAFCLGLNWLRHSKVLPDMIGITAHGACSVPWEAELRGLRAAGAAPERLDACVEQSAAQILAAVRDTPPDPNLPRQIRYYTRTHRRLNVGTQ
jgi:tetratricopeptide (TPR) repeat protein